MSTYCLGIQVPYGQRTNDLVGWWGRMILPNSLWQGNRDNDKASPIL